MAEKAKQEVTKQQKIMLAVLMAVGLYMAYKHFYLPLGVKIKDLTVELKDKETKLNATRIRASQLSKLQREFDIMIEDLADAEKQLPKEKDVSDIMRIVTRMMEKHGLKYKNFTPMGEVGKQYFSELLFSVNADSTLQGISEFMTDIGQMERIFAVKDLRIDRKEATSFDPTTVACSFIVVTYVSK